MARYRYSGITEQRKASIRRKKDADSLRAAHRWRGAMYLLGYAMECSLKARLMERFEAMTLEDLEMTLASRLAQSVDLKTHSLDTLFEYTKAEHRLGPEQRRSFGLCRMWTVEWRYDPSAGSLEECDEFFEACSVFLRFVESSV